MFSLYKIISRHVEQIIYKEITQVKGIALRDKNKYKDGVHTIKSIFRCYFFETGTRSEKK